MKHKGFLIIPALIAAISAPEILSAKENVGPSAGKVTPPSINASCVEATAQSDLAVNNVRCRVLMGDMWWDLANGAYEVPKDGGVMAIFAGSLWIGGIDQGGQLKVAAQTYRQTGNDFWPGPLKLSDASVDLDVCAKYDKHFRITRKEVETFVSNGTITSAITNWPGNGDQSLDQAQYLAPFFDANADGVYSPSAGDYPGYDLVSGDAYGDCQQTNCIPVDQLFGDETLWWVFNDKGNIHGETSGQQIGLEIRAQAFGFFTDDEINNMTFYNYRIFNRSTFQVDSCYFGVWCDADLGCYTDDFVGCDVARGFGYTYNGDNDDEVNCASPGYGANPPAIGIDFFRGPIADGSDGIDNDRNCQIDEPCEQIIMSGFLYYDNVNGVPYGNPSGATHFYNYLRSRWGDGSHVQYTGNGYNSGGPDCNFMYPGNPTTDQHDWGIGGNCSTVPTLGAWDEVLAGNTPNDRRMLESAGPFTLLPGALNVITTGVAWARATAGGAQASVSLLRVVDDKAQALFDNCFRVLDGPNAPDVTIQELDKELILYLSNSDPGSNNYNETYTEFDPLIALVDTSGNLVTVDTTFDFEGYKVYQVKDQTVTATELNDPDRARLIAQSDVKNGITRIINYEFDQSLGAGVPVEKVDGKDLGIQHSIRITTDAFATGSPNLINHKTYYFLAVAYGYNEFKKYQQDTPPAGNPLTPAYDGQKKPYKQGRKNIFAYSAIPHIATPETGGTEAHGSYGSGPMIKRIEGNGNGGTGLEMTAASIAAAIAPPYRNLTPEYEYSAGPISVKVIDPLNVPDGNNFTFKFDTMASITYAAAGSVFQVGETVTGGTSGATAVIVSDNGSFMHINSITGSFMDGEGFTGGTSSAIGKIATFNPGNSINTATWSLTNNTTGQTIWSYKTITLVNEQIIPQWGIAIAIEQIADPGDAASTNNGLISSSITFADPTKKWLSSVVDKDGPYFENWIRAGSTVGDDFQTDYPGIDVDQYYETVVTGSWSPYRLTACSYLPYTPATKYYTGPGFKSNFMNLPQMKDLSSVNIVLTADKSKWTRAVVLEMSEDSSQTVNSTGGIISSRARKLDFRRAPSVDKNGAANYPSTDNNDFSTGMGWFPGYAVNMETGERLNIAFGENSALTGGVYEQNGADMKWNPTTKSSDSIPWMTGSKGPVLGGQHYIYVFGHNKINTPASVTPLDTINVPRYDGGVRIRQILGFDNNLPADPKKRELFRDAMWVNIPLLATGHSLLETDVTVKIRVGKSYKPGYSPEYYANGTVINYTDTAVIPQNSNLPMYTFTTNGIATHTNVNDLAVEALDLINVVPNPYYAYSAYETSVLDNRVKITNLPEECTVSIYNLGGTLVRKYKKGEPKTNHTPKALGDEPSWHDGAIDWDLKNLAGIPISSGVYIIHVEVPGVGEKIVKWFGVMRPIDLDSF